MRPSSSGPIPKWKSAPSGSATSRRKNVADALAADPPHDLADQEAEGVDVVAVGPPRLPPRLLLGERGGHQLPVVHRQRREAARRIAGRPARWLRSIADGDLALPGGRELAASNATPARRGRPASLSTSISRQSAAIALPTEKTSTRVSRCHGRVRARSAHPPQMSTTERALDGDRDRRADLAALAEVLGEGAAHTREALIAGAVDLRHGTRLEACGAANRGQAERTEAGWGDTSPGAAADHDPDKPLLREGTVGAGAGGSPVPRAATRSRHSPDRGASSRGWQHGSGACDARRGDRGVGGDPRLGGRPDAARAAAVSRRPRRPQ